MKLSELKTNPDNPRTITDEKLQLLKNSIKEFERMMEARPIVVDENKIVLGGNMRALSLQKLGYIDIPDNWVFVMDGLTEEQKREFVIKDNAGFGEWDWDKIRSDWADLPLGDWGLDVPEIAIEVNEDELTDSFDLKDGDREPFQQITFTLADEQAIQIKNAIEEIKKTEEFKYCETLGNENGNGNALYLIIMQWAELKTSF